MYNRNEMLNILLIWGVSPSKRPPPPPPIASTSLTYKKCMYFFLVKRHKLHHSTIKLHSEHFWDIILCARTNREKRLNNVDIATRWRFVYVMRSTKGNMSDAMLGLCESKEIGLEHPLPVHFSQFCDSSHRFRDINVSNLWPWKVIWR